MLETEEQILSKQPYVPIIPLLPADLESHINKFKDGSSFRYSYNSTSLTSTKSFKKTSGNPSTRCELCLKNVSVYLQCQGYCGLKFCSACCGIKDIKRMSRVYRELWRCKYCRRNSCCRRSEIASNGVSEDSSEVSSDSECSQSNSKAQWVNGMVNGRWRKKQKLDKPRDYKLNSIQCDVSNRRTTIQRSSRFYANCKNTETVKNSLSRQLRSSSRKVRKSYTSAYDSGSNAPSSSSSSSLSLSSSSSSSSSEEDDDKTQEQRTEINKIKTCQKDLRSQPLTRDASGSGKFLRPKPTPTLRYKATVVLERLQIKSQFKNKDSEKTNSCKPSKPQKKYKFIATPQRKRNHVKDSEESDSDFYYSSDRAALHVTVGDFVWAKLGSQRWWPAIIIWGADCGQPAAKHNQTWVLWCGEHKISEVPKNKLLNFVTHFNRKFNGFAGYKFEKGIIVVLTELAVRAKVQGISKEPKSLITWAKNGFPSTQKKSNPFAPDPECPIPDSIRKRLNRIKAQYLKTMWSEQGVSLIPRFVRSEQLQDEESALKKVRQGILKIQEVCIACDASNVDIVAQHPLIEGGLCSYCKEEITETMFAYGDDGTNAYCVICGQAGELLICDNHDCNRCYCTGCIDVLVSPGAHIKVRNSSPWLCYLCRPYDAELNGLIQRKEDWQQSVMLFFKSNDNIQFPPNMEDYKEKKPVRVLSLFDGIGTGRLVLEQLGIDVDIYYASEIDKDAINIALVQHRGNIVHLGDIEDITDVEVAKLCPIDLVIGGSPCNDLALVNPRRKGLYDPTGTGKLFFDFFRVLRAVQMANKGRHVFWLYENVAGMPSQYKSTITRFLQCEPTLVDAKYFSAQRRARFFWGNIPGMYTVQEYWSAEEMPNPLQNEELYQTVTLNSVLTPYLNRKASLEKIGSLTTQTNSLRQGKVGMYPVTMNGEEDTLWITELEEVFGFPRHYTDVGNVQLKRRQELLGKAWSVPVIRHLFTSLRNFFKTLPSSFLQKTGNKES